MRFLHVFLRQSSADKENMAPSLAEDARAASEPPPQQTTLAVSYQLSHFNGRVQWFTKKRIVKMKPKKENSKYM